METFTHLTAKQLRKAADLKERIDALQESLGELLGATAPAPVVATEKRKRKKISAAGIARIRAAQKARWAAMRTGDTAPKRKRKVSAAGRAKLSALARARWAKVKAAGKSSL